MSTNDRVGKDIKPGDKAGDKHYVAMGKATGNTPGNPVLPQRPRSVDDILSEFGDFGPASE